MLKRDAFSKVLDPTKKEVGSLEAIIGAQNLKTQQLVSYFNVFKTGVEYRYTKSIS
jgi:hypothetical protein